jgi:uncharacterized DUF497 family protein
MKLVWDEPKRRANLEKHGLDFALLEEEFDWRTAVAIPAEPSRTGRARTIFVGQVVDDLVVVVVASQLGAQALSIVSMRPANRRERELYANQQV